MLPNYFVIFWDNQPVGLDTGSGGYPFKTNYPGDVRFWKSREEAESYIRIVDFDLSKRMTIKEIQFRIVGGE